VNQPLSLLRLRPDREALSRWAAERRFPGSKADLGYVWHSLLKATLGEFAPQPFVDRIGVDSDELLGYSAAAPDVLLRLAKDESHDSSAVAAIRLENIVANDLPVSWSAGRFLSFEVRARPVVRSRSNPRSGNTDEIDVAPHRAAREPGVTREQAYVDWLAAQVSRDGAAVLEIARLHAFSRTRVVRRIGDGNDRRWISVEGPDAWMRGRLRVIDSDAFNALLRRGIGRHRAFGFGCLLIAPPGVLE
jgi:CRISPR system Cascade subunit CasE